MKRHFFAVLLCLALAALALRAIVCFQLADSPEVASPNSQSDMATYIRLAQDIRQGSWPDHFDYQPFYYTVILPFLLPASGTKAPLMTFQALVGAASVLLAGLCAAQVFGKRNAWSAALLLALARFHIFYTPFALYEVLQGFWLILLLYLTLLAWRHNRPWMWLTSALVLAAATLTRGNAILFLPVVLSAVLIRNWQSSRRKGCALALAVMLLAYVPQLPFAIRNYQFSGRWTGASTAAAKVLVLGNSPEAPAAGLAYPFTYSSWVEQDEKGIRPATANILNWLLHAPLSFLELKFRTALHFWDSAEIPNNVNINAHGYPFSPLLKMPFLIDFGLLAPLAFAGLFLAIRRKSPARRLLIAFTLVFFAATTLFYMLARFRLACFPLLCVLAAGTVASLFNMAANWKNTPRQLRQRRLLAASGALAAGLFLVHAALFIYQMGYEADIVAAIAPKGTCVTSPNGDVLIHDHAALPMGVGGAHPLYIPESQSRQSLAIRKQFYIPQDMVQRLKGKPFTVRLMLATTNFTVEALPHIVFVHDSRRKSPKLETRYAFCHFLEAAFEEMSIDQDNTATVVFELPASAADKTVFDFSRHFGRTATSLGGAPFMQTDEAFAELQATTGLP